MRFGEQGGTIRTSANQHRHRHRISKIRGEPKVSALAPVRVCKLPLYSEATFERNREEGGLKNEEIAQTGSLHFEMTKTTQLPKVTQSGNGGAP